MANEADQKAHAEEQPGGGVGGAQEAHDERPDQKQKKQEGSDVQQEVFHSGYDRLNKMYP